MRHSFILLSLLTSFTSSAVISPRHERWPAPIIEYYAAVSHRISSIRSEKGQIPPSCNLSDARLPPSALPPHSSNLTVYHVAIGRGTQNYTCTSDTAMPVAAGALATLFNASCIAADYPEILATLPNATLQVELPAQGASLFPSNSLTSGHHYFSDATTPTFNLDTQIKDYGITFSKKNSSTPAPVGAAAGPVGVSPVYGAVPWLKLTAKEMGTVGTVKEVYRVNTAGGNPPPTCSGKGSQFEVQYAAEYWFFSP